MAAAFAITTIATPDTASAQRDGGGEKRGGGGEGNRGGGGGGGEKRGGGEGNRSGGGGGEKRGGGEANRSGGGGNRGGGENRGGGAAQSRGNASAQPKANVKQGGGAPAQRDNANARPRTQPRVDVNAQQRSAAQAQQNARNAQAQQNARNAQAQQNARNSQQDSRNAEAQQNARNAQQNARNAQTQQNARKAEAQQNARGQAQTRTFSRDGNDRDNNALTRDNSARDKNGRDNNARDKIANDVNRRNQADRGKQNREPNLGARFNENNNRLTVNNITAKSAAAQVGMRDGDQIVSVDGRNVASQRDFHSSLGRYAHHHDKNHRVPVIVRRNGNLETLYWTNLALGLAFGGHRHGYGYGPYGHGDLGGRYYGSFYGPYRYGVGYRNGGYDSGYGYYDNNYDNGYVDSGQTIVQQDIPQPDPNAAFLGVVLDTRYGTAAVVRDVYSFSPADTAGLQPGDTITRVNDQPISAPNDLSGTITQLQPGSKVMLELTGPNPRTIEIVLSTRAEAQQALEAARPSLQEGEGLPVPNDGNPVAPPQLPQPGNFE